VFNSGPIRPILFTPTAYYYKPLNLKQNFRQMAYNVPAVYDVFAVAIKEREAFQQPQKCGGEKTHKGRSPTGFFRSPSRFSGEAYTVLLGEVKPLYLYIYFLK
jgi:hypothetical protein